MVPQSKAAGDVTLLLGAWRSGDPDALPEIINMVYGDLRRLAAAYFRGERPDHTLQPTALVHEVYRQMAEARPVFHDREHFLRCACLMMRRLLVKHARGRKALKREATPMAVEVEARDPDTVLAVNDALDDLERMDPRLARITAMRFFLGLTVAETAAYLQLSNRTVKREWLAARAWLARRIDPGRGLPLES